MSTPIPPHTGPLVIGRSVEWVAFIGVLDEVASYDYHLPAARVQAHYQAGSGAQ